jgi:hypothetical protein
MTRNRGESISFSSLYFLDWHLLKSMSYNTHKHVMFTAGRLEPLLAIQTHHIVCDLKIQSNFLKTRSQTIHLITQANT